MLLHVRHDVRFLRRGLCRKLQVSIDKVFFFFFAEPFLDCVFASSTGFGVAFLLEARGLLAGGPIVVSSRGIKWHSATPSGY